MMPWSIALPTTAGNSAWLTSHTTPNSTAIVRVRR